MKTLIKAVLIATALTLAGGAALPAAAPAVAGHYIGGGTHL